MNFPHKPFIISIGGIAKSGKGSFSKLLQTELLERDISFHIESFAFPLRQELELIIKENFDISVWNPSPEEKELIRPMFVSWAHIRRRQTKGRYFIDKLRDRIKNLDHQIIIIDDARFKEFEYDELDYIKKNGLLVHLKKYILDWDDEKCYFVAPNEFERRNDPILEKFSDYKIDWPEVGAQNVIQLEPYVDQFISWLEEKYK